MSLKRDRDKTPGISWEDLSPFVTDIRGRLKLAGLGSRGINEFKVTLVHARPALEELAQHSGDPRFALYVLATARWRRLIPHEPRAPAWRKALEALEGDEALHRLLQDREAPRAQLRTALGDALAFLQTLGWQDEGLFDNRSIRKTAGGPRWAGHHVDRAAAVLKWHVHTGTRGRWDRLTWLARMLQTFGLIAPSGADPVPVERIKKRLRRLDIGFVAQFVIPDGRFFFHTLHTDLGAGCGSACPETPPTGNSHRPPAD